MRARRLLCLVAAGALLAACSDDGDRAAADSTTTSRPVVTAGPVAATELLIGDCLSGLVIGVSERINVDAVRVVSCDGPHELEVFAVFDLAPGDFTTEVGEYPGRERVVTAADQGCTARFEEVIDEGAPLGLLAVWPTQVSWSTGDRSVVCAAYSTDGMPFEERRLIAG